MRNTDGVAYEYARQILGLPPLADLPQDLEDKIYWSQRAMHVVRSGKDLSLESVALLAYPWLKADYDMRVAEAEAKEKAFQEQKEEVKKTVRKKASTRRKIAAEVREAEKAGE